MLRGVDQKGRVPPSGLHRDSIGYISKRAASRAGMDVANVAVHSNCTIATPICDQDDARCFLYSAAVRPSKLTLQKLCQLVALASQGQGSPV